MKNMWIFVFMLLVLPPVCGTTFRFVNFSYYPQSVTWSEAQSWCRNTGTDLVTIRNNFEAQLVPMGEYWIGLYRENNASPWKWSRGNETANFFNWAINEPQYDKHCGIKWYNYGKWFNDKCNAAYPILCSDEKLILVTDNKTWEEAFEYCRSLQGVSSVNPAYNLVALITDDEHNYARQKAQQATTDEVWTGLRFMGDDWFWVSGESVQYQGIPSCPAVNCGVLEKNSLAYYGMRDCSQRRNFFCYKN